MERTLSAPAEIVVVPGLRALADRYDLLLCDIWGVVHDGERSFPAAREALRRFRAKGGTVALITNAPRPAADILAQLAELGVEPECHDAVVTSGDATLALIAAQGGGRALHVGPPRDLALYEAARRADPSTAPELSALERADYVVCTGLDDDETETVEDYAPRLAAMKARDLTMICANPDLAIHRGERLIPCAGALGHAYGLLGGRTSMAGKPHAPIYELAIETAQKASGRPFARARILGVGDGLHTDVAGARGRGLDALLVAGGLHRAELLDGEAIRPDALARLCAQGERSAAAPTHAIARFAW